CLSAQGEEVRPLRARAPRRFNILGLPAASSAAVRRLAAPAAATLVLWAGPDSEVRPPRSTTDANFGIDGHWQVYDSSAAFEPEVRTAPAAIVGELRVRGARPGPSTRWRGELASISAEPSPTWRWSTT